MDFIQRSGIKIPNAVIVCGATDVADQEEQVLDFLKKYGYIERVLRISDISSEFYQNLIVEFSSGQTLESLEQLLPHELAVQGDLYEVKALGSVYTANIAKTYLAELRDLAKLSGREYGEVLREMMSQMSGDIETMQPMAAEPDAAHIETTVLTPQSVTHPELRYPLSDTPQISNTMGVTDPVPIVQERRASSLSVRDLNPPEIQRVVVEHIVRREASLIRLRSFSGKTPRPNNELTTIHGAHTPSCF